MRRPNGNVATAAGHARAGREMAASAAKIMETACRHGAFARTPVSRPVDVASRREKIVGIREPRLRR
jgi:hypothetical protein